MESREHPVTLQAAGLPIAFIQWREDSRRRSSEERARAMFRAAIRMEPEQHLSAAKEAAKAAARAEAATDALRKVATEQYGQGRPWGQVAETVPYPCGTWKHWTREARDQVYASDAIRRAWMQLAQMHWSAAGKRATTFRQMIEA